MKNAVASFVFVALLSLGVIVVPAFAEQANTAASSSEVSGLAVFLSWVPLLVLIASWFAYAAMMKRTQSRFYDRYSKIAEEQNALLKEILAELKRK